MNAEEAGRIGREAVALGMPCQHGITCTMESQTKPGEYSSMVMRHSYGLFGWPDFRDELTALACIPWVRSSWRSRRIGLRFEFCAYEDGAWCVCVTTDSGSRICTSQGSTLAHACIAAVRAAQGKTT